VSKLLFDSHPLVILPELAVKIGLNEALILQQIHYWLEINKKANRNLKNGYYWTFNSYTDWKKQFPFFSDSTIRRTITKLEKGMLVVSGNYNKLSIDRTKWYRIDEEVLKMLDNYPCGQNEQINWSEWINHVVSLTLPIPETSTEINSQTTLLGIASNDDNSREITLTFSEYESRYIVEEDEKESIGYYLKLYKRVMRKDHIKYSVRQWSSNVDEWFSLFDKRISKSFDNDIYVMENIIDAHFKTRYNTGEYSISHFLSGKIKINRYYEIRFDETREAN
jgi:hypothetical protein